MANLKQFGLIGLANDVQVGRVGPRLLGNAAALSVVAANSTSNAVVYAPLTVGAPVASNDAATKEYVDQAITTLGNVFSYAGTVTGNTQVSPFDLSGLTETDAGSYYKVTTDGWFAIGGSTFFAGLGDALVFNTSGGVDRFDNFDANIAGTANFVTVESDPATGFTINVAEVFTDRIGAAEGLMANIASDLSVVAGNASDIANTVNLLIGEVDAVSDAIGLAANGAFLANAQTTYLGNATSIQNALERIDTQVTTVANLDNDRIVSQDFNTVVRAYNANVTVSVKDEAARTARVEFVPTAGVLTITGAQSDLANGVTSQAFTLDPKGNGVVSVGDALIANVADLLSNSANSALANLTYVANRPFTIGATNVFRFELSNAAPLYSANWYRRVSLYSVAPYVTKVRIEVTQAYNAEAEFRLFREDTGMPNYYGSTIAGNEMVDLTVAGVYEFDVTDDDTGGVIAIETKNATQGALTAYVYQSSTAL